MFSNHVAQLVHLATPEFPKVFTNFENQVGEYSVAYKKAKEDFEIVAKVVKNQYNYVLIVRYKQSKVYDVIPYSYAHNITEDYGYATQDCIPELDVGDTVYKDEFLYKTPNYDEDGNFRYGVNLKAVYIPWNNMTYEDGVIISKSAAEKLTSYKVEKTMFSVNGNDVLLNLYGDEANFKSFPKVGDKTGNKILVASRRRDKRTSLYDFQAKNMTKVDYVDDEPIYTNGGTVVDINIFNNISLSELKKKTFDEKGNIKNVFNYEILTVLEDQYRYWNELKTELEKIIPCKSLSEAEEREEMAEYHHIVKHPIDKDKNPNKYTDELAYYWKLAHENTDDQIQWRFDGKTFDNFKIQFVILKENHLTEGCKITRTLPATKVSSHK